MPDALLLVGASHHTAPLAIRERLAVPRSRLPATLLTLRERTELREVAWLSTCNRTEIVAVGEAATASSVITEELIRVGRLTSSEADSVLYHRWESGCVEHLFRVAAGIDSLVIGEAQILGQLRQAQTLAQAAGTLGPRTSALLREALRAGRRVRQETGIGRGAGSVSSASIRLARQVCGTLEDRTVLVIGAGEAAELVAQALVASGARRSLIVNRSPHRAERLATRFGGRAMPYERTDDLLAEADIVISSTDAPHPVVRAATLARMRAGRTEPICLIDLAVPRDVEPAVAHLPGVHLYNVDDLRAVVEQDLAGRWRSLSQAEAIVREATAEFGRLQAARRVAPEVVAFRNRAHAIRLRELARWEPRLRRLDPAERVAVAALTRSIVNKMLHAPTVRFKQAAAGSEAETYRRVLQDLFVFAESSLGTP